ncbi:Acetoacetyl-CoA reductase OS=Castellaniella defragrans OX=75697 GN=HNR28_003206 PE=3 SV=1 [Castellaniella defragrans]
MKTTQERPVALVTGARRGIGRGICLELAKAGFDLVMNDIARDAAMEESMEEATAHGARVRPFIGDITDNKVRPALAEFAWTHFGNLNCLVNNAGISVKARGDILDVTEASYDRLLDTNLKSMFFLTQAVASRMLTAPAPAFPRTIINISSANSIMASQNRAEYCISKAGISMATKLYALRLAPAGINVYEIRPGVIESDMTRVARADYDRRIAEGLTPIPRIGLPRDVGQAIACLAQGTAFPFSTGDAFHIDGGLHIQQL